jgi:hypothetical protein
MPSLSVISPATIGRQEKRSRRAAKRSRTVPTDKKPRRYGVAKVSYTAEGPTGRPPNRLNQSGQRRGYAIITRLQAVPDYRFGRRRARSGAAFCPQSPALRFPFINPSRLWAILVCPRSYPHARSLDFIDDRDGYIHRVGAGLGRRGYVGLGYRLTQSRGSSSHNRSPHDSRKPAGEYRNSAG